MFRYVFTICAALLFLCPSIAQAETDKKTAQKLEKMFTLMLEDYSGKADKNGFTLVTDGAIMVEESDNSYYAVTLPSLSLRYPDGDMLKIGMIAANVLPTEKTDEWKISMAIPTPLTYYNKDNIPAMRVHFGSQHFSGIWNERLQHYSKFDGRYQDVLIESAELDSHIKIPNIAMSMNLTDNDKGEWSGQGKYSADGTTITADNGSILTIGKAAMIMDMYDYAAHKAHDYQEKLEALSESIEAGDVALDGSKQHTLGLYNLLTNVIGDIWDGFSLTMIIENIEMKAGKTEMLDKPEHASLDKIGFGFTMKGFHEDSVTVGARGHYEGLSISPPPAQYDGTLPDHMNFDVSINRLPYRKLADLGRDTLKKIATSPSMAQIAGLQALALAPQILTKAGTNLAIKDSVVGNNEYHIKFDGMATTDIQAMLGGTANARAEIFGIDTLLGYFAKNMEKPDLSDEERALIEKNMQSLEMLKRLGLSAQNEQGKFIMGYDFELTEDGKMLLNGRDLGESLANEDGTTPQDGK